MPPQCVGSDMASKMARIHQLGWAVAKRAYKGNSSWTLVTHRRRVREIARTAGGLIVGVLYFLHYISAASSVWPGTAHNCCSGE
ncbi:hypothetical protein BDW66DRAFT_133564 [Aspergillus desertorum]